MKKPLLTIGILILASSHFVFSQFTSSSFYVIGHQDDWQFFMGINAYNDMDTITKKVVYIYLTAGDACYGTRNCAYQIPYFQSREDGAKNSVYLVVDNSTNPPAGSNRPSDSTVSINQNLITRWQYKNVVKYFLRLPDGRVHFDNPSHFSCGLDFNDSTYINCFRRDLLKRLSDVTGLTTYIGWTDLVATIRTILNSEKIGSTTWINTHEFSPALNIGTHSDHRETGLIVENIYNQHLGYNVAYYIDYYTNRMPVNLSNDDIMKETSLYAAYYVGKINDGCSVFPDWSWCLRDYVSRYFYDAKF